LIYLCFFPENMADMISTSREPSVSMLASAPRLGQSSLRLTHRIRRSPDLPEILSATVVEVQQFLELDRVKICQFHGDGSGQVIAECRSQPPAGL
jgi:light-regulated signal transduction histidine kinase (bacteriophytochrome)